MVNEFINLFERNMNQLKAEIDAYKDEKNMWTVPKGVTNSSGNLCLHLMGNLNHFIGHLIGKTNYVRNRELEFSNKNVPKSELLSSIEETNNTIKRSLKDLDEKLMLETFPVEVFGKPMTYHYFLMHLIGHLEYHRGQINYLRRITEPA